MDSMLLKQALIKFFAGLLVIGLLLFVPAGTISYWQAWLLIGILFVPMFIAGLIMMKKCPDLLRKRLNMKEEQTEQKEVILLSGLMFVAAFIVAGLNFRFKWIILPDWVSYAAAVVFLIAYALYAEVLRENAYLSRTVEVQKNQKVIDTRLYGIVRHPMYMSTLFLFLSMPLVLGSVISFVIRDALHEMRIIRCDLMEELHQNQRRVDCLDYLIRKTEKSIKMTTERR